MSANGNGNGKKLLRFAALVRVSSEQQEKEGESLRTQKTSIEKTVEGLGGMIVEWYGGQEHATPGYEKKEVNRLVQEAQKQPKRFDAVIVARPDRWSRDNEHSKAGLEVFRVNDIRFFTGTTEWDLFNPAHKLFLGMSAEIGEFLAHNQTSASIDSRIERANRGVPTGGKLPYGRNFIRAKDRASGEWVVDKDKQAIIEDAAKRYLAGASIHDLAKEHGMNAANLHRVLTQGSGTQWQIRFKSKVLKTVKTVEMKIPALLDDKTIKAIHAKAQANKTYTHGKIKHDYLFRSLIFCAHCGYTITGQPNNDGRLYYRHINAERDRLCNGPKKKKYIPIGPLEDNVMRHLFETFGNPTAVQRAMEQATPNTEKIQDAVKRQGDVSKQVVKVKASIQRVIGLVANETITEDDAKSQLEKLKEQEGKLRTELTRLDDELAHIPSSESIKTAAKQIAGRFRYTNARLWAKTQHVNEAFDEMSYEEKRLLCQAVFGGKTADGRRMGVWITWSDDGKKWRYRIEGHFIDAEGPVRDSWFVFGAATRQKELVSKSTRSWGHRRSRGKSHYTRR